MVSQRNNMDLVSQLAEAGQTGAGVLSRSGSDEQSQQAAWDASSKRDHMGAFAYLA